MATASTTSTCRASTARCREERSRSKRSMTTASEAAEGGGVGEGERGLRQDERVRLMEAALVRESGGLHGPRILTARGSEPRCAAGGVTRTEGLAKIGAHCSALEHAFDQTLMVPLIPMPGRHAPQGECALPGALVGALDRPDHSERVQHVGRDLPQHAIITSTAVAASGVGRGAWRRVGQKAAAGRRVPPGMPRGARPARR
eukprot:scaffold2056_cov129-Isochrysis_galbana.AAC.3